MLEVFEVYSLRFRCSVPGYGCMLEDSGLRIQGYGVRVQGETLKPYLCAYTSDIPVYVQI